MITRKKLAKHLFTMYCDSDVSFIKACTLYSLTKHNSKINKCIKEYIQALIEYDDHMSLSNYRNLMRKLDELLISLKIYKYWRRLTNEI